MRKIQNLEVHEILKFLILIIFTLILYTAGLDFVAVNLSSLLFPSGADSVSFNISIIADEMSEPNETFGVNLALAEPAILLTDETGE